MSNKITRQGFLDHLSKKNQEHQALDDLDKKALEGYEYLDQDRDASEVLGQLDKRFEDLLEKGTSTKKKNRIFRLSTIQKIATALLLLLAPIFLLTRGPSMLGLFEDNFDLPRSTYFQLNRGADAQPEDEIYEAFVLYEKGSYKEASSKIEKLTSKYPEKKDLTFYQGTSALAAGNYSTAEILLNKCLDVSFQQINVRTPWYLALCHLAQKEKQDAIKWLEKTIDVDERHRDQALKLLDELR